MRILFLTSAYDSLSQRLWIELGSRGHEVSVCIASDGEAMISAAIRERPNLIIAPMLEVAIPEDVRSRYLCLIVHPGIRGYRGPSSLDWAMALRESILGVTILEAANGLDSGAVWATQEFPIDGDVRAKSSLYRGPVTEAAVRGILEAIARFESAEYRCGLWRPEALPSAMPGVPGCPLPRMRQADRAVDWTRDTTADILWKIRAGDSAPGVLGSLLGRQYYFFGAHEEELLTGRPGKILAQRDGAICLGTRDGAIWISHLKAKLNAATANRSHHRPSDTRQSRTAGIKLPAATALGSLLVDTFELPLPIDAPGDLRTYREIRYSEEDAVGYLAFDFYNGTMTTDRCRRLRDAFLYARSRPTRIIVLLGGIDFWSNGIDLNSIEASPEPAIESWRNMNAIDDLIFEVLTTMSHLVVAGMRGNAGAGGAMLALAADRIYAPSSVIINPHYRRMGGLGGSEYATYTLPKRVGASRAHELTQACLPIGARTAYEIGFLDDTFGTNAASFEPELRERAARLAADPAFRTLLREKHDRRMDDEARRPLASYRADELARLRSTIFGPDQASHEARRNGDSKAKPPANEGPAYDFDHLRRDEMSPVFR
jgi:putative two-component system hydrogenase maturation factor HypX/HoxX